MSLGTSAREPHPSADESYRLKVYLALAAVAALRLWGMPLTASLWLDETVTFWSVCKGIVPAISRSQFWPGQNLLYTIIAALAIRVGGPSEAVLRLPSLLAALGTAWLLFRLGKRLFDRETGVLALVVFASMQEMSKTAPNARPYALGLLMVVASMLELVRWLDTGNKRHLLGYVMFATAVVYFHYLFATIYFVQAIYTTYRLRRGGPIRWPHLIAAVAIIGLLISPLVLNAVRVKRVSTKAVFAATPDFGEAVSSLMPAALGAGIFAGLLLGYVLYRKASVSERPAMSSEIAVLLLSWLLIPIITLFAGSRLTDFKLFVYKYYLPSILALALLVAWGIRILLPEKVRVWVAVGIVLAAIASFGSHHLRVNPHLEDWRAAAEAVRNANLGEETPVLVRPGLIETAKATWDISIDRDSPLLCPLSKYPMPGRIVLVPVGLDRDNIRYMEEVSSRMLEPANQFVLVTRDQGDVFTPWLMGRFSHEGFVASKLGHADGVTATLFRRGR
jgi:mannosyltransferase